MARFQEEVTAVPPELARFVVSQPALELPRISAPDVRSARELYLGGKGIEVLWGFQLFESLEVLWVNGNRLREIENIEACFRLRELYAQDNRIDNLNGSLRFLRFLRVLNLGNNALANLDACLEVLSRFEFLADLDLRGNPVTQEVGYRGRVIAAIPSLRTLDKHPVTETEREKAESTYERRLRGRVLPPKVRRSAAAPAEELRRAGSPPGAGSGTETLRRSAFLAGEVGTGRALTDTGRPVFGAEGDTLVGRTLQREARSIARKRRAAEHEAAVRATTAGGLGSPLRLPLGSGASGGGLLPVRSALSNSLPLADSLMDRAVGRAMLARGCDESDLRRAGIGVFRELAHVTQREIRSAARGSTGVGTGGGAGATGGGGLALSSSLLTSARLGGGRGVSANGGLASARTTSSAHAGSAFPEANRAIRVSVHPILHDAGALSEWDKIRLREVFREADRDGSGALTVDEMLGAMRSAADLGFCLAADAEASVRKLFNALDHDGSGSVEWREFAAAISRAVAVPPAAQAGDAEADASDEGEDDDDGDGKGADLDVRAASPRSAHSGTKSGTKTATKAVTNPSQSQRGTRAKHGALKPRVQFRPLREDEARLRAERLFARAKVALDSAARNLLGDPAERKAAEDEAANLAARGSKLLEVAESLRGRFDPPERPPPPPPPRRDFLTTITSVPIHEAKKTLRRGNRDYVPPPPGLESDSDTDDEDGKGRGPQWAAFRLRAKARKPHVTFRRTISLQ